MEGENAEKSIEKKAKKENKITLVEAARSGNKKKTLIALRDKLAESIEHCESGRDMAANSKRLMEVMQELDEIKTAEKIKREQKAAAQKPKSKRDQLRALNAR